MVCVAELYSLATLFILNYKDPPKQIANARASLDLSSIDTFSYPMRLVEEVRAVLDDREVERAEFRDVLELGLGEAQAQLR